MRSIGSVTDTSKEAGAAPAAARVVTAMTEHPGWSEVSPGVRRRVGETADGGRWLAESVVGGPIRLMPLDPGVAAPGPVAAGGTPQLDEVRYTAAEDARPAAALAEPLRSLGTVVRLRNPDLWDAITVAILRQVIRAGQSKRLYRSLCQAHGRQVTLPEGGQLRLCPTPETVLSLTADEFTRLGLAFKRTALQAAAAAYLEQGESWRTEPAPELVTRLQSVPRIGPWTAGAAVADWSNDFAVYPYGDLAVRTWARRAAPEHDWPDDEAAFARAWASASGRHLSDLTLLTLAWGSLRGDIG